MAPRKSNRVLQDKAMSFHPTKVITVVVGQTPKEQLFMVHEGIMTGRSEFFRRALSGNWKENEERLVKLPKDDPDIFAIYINLVYTNNLPTSATDQIKSSEQIRLENIALGKLYVLGEKLQDIAAKNAAVTALLAVAAEKATDGSTYTPPSFIVNLMYTDTPKGSPGQRLVMDLWTLVRPDCMSKLLGSTHKDFLVDLAVALRTGGTPKFASDFDIANYLEKERDSG